MSPAGFLDAGCWLRKLITAGGQGAVANIRQAPDLMLTEAPARLTSRFAEGNICDAFLAATADYFARTHGIPTPECALKEDLVLVNPWFSPPYPTVRTRLLRDTPSAFKDKNIFIFEDALTVA